DADGFAAVQEQNIAVLILGHGGHGMDGAVLGPDLRSARAEQAEVLNRHVVLGQQRSPTVHGTIQHGGRRQALSTGAAYEKTAVAGRDAAVVEVLSTTHISGVGFAV